MATARELVIALVLRFEGMRLRPYYCPAGVATIGGGSTHYEDGSPVRITDPAISRERAMSLLERDVDAFLGSAGKLSPVLLREVARKAAIADFIYNMGPGRYRASTLRRKVAERNWPGAREQLMKWVFGGGRKLRGLVIRRTAEAMLLAPGGSSRSVPPAAVKVAAPKPDDLELPEAPIPYLKLVKRD